jgi:hypothetical protein
MECAGGLERASTTACQRALVCAPSLPPWPGGKAAAGRHLTYRSPDGEVPQVLGSHFRTMRTNAGEEMELEAQAHELRTHRAMEVQGELRAAVFDNCQELLCDGVRLLSMVQILQLFQVGCLWTKSACLLPVHWLPIQTIGGCKGGVR